VKIGTKSQSSRSFMRRIGIMDLKTVPEFKVLRLHVRIQSFSKVSRKMQFLYQFNHIRVVAQPDDRCPCREFCFNQSIQSEQESPSISTATSAGSG
jgi:hypothetical protein